MPQRQIAPHWRPAAWEEHGYQFYDRLQIAAQRLGDAVAAQIATQAIELIDRALTESTSSRKDHHRANANTR